MSYMFSKCCSLIEINLSNFNTNKVTNMYSMFNYCYSLKDINISNFSIKNVINMHYMFSRCQGLKTKVKSQIKNIRKEAFYSDF